MIEHLRKIYIHELAERIRKNAIATEIADDIDMVIEELKVLEGLQCGYESSVWYDEFTGEKFIRFDQYTISLSINHRPLRSSDTHLEPGGTQRSSSYNTSCA